MARNLVFVSLVRMQIFCVQVQAYSTEVHSQTVTFQMVASLKKEIIGCFLDFGTSFVFVQSKLQLFVGFESSRAAEKFYAEIYLSSTLPFLKVIHRPQRAPVNLFQNPPLVLPGNSAICCCNFLVTFRKNTSYKQSSQNYPKTLVTKYVHFTLGCVSTMILLGILSIVLFTKKINSTKKTNIFNTVVLLTLTQQIKQMTNSCRFHNARFAHFRYISNDQTGTIVQNSSEKGDAAISNQTLVQEIYTSSCVLLQHYRHQSLYKPWQQVLANSVY